MDDLNSGSSCHVCCRLFEFQTDHSFFPYTDLEGAVQCGCRTCYILWEGINRMLNSIGSEKKPVRLTVEGIHEDRLVATVSYWDEEDRGPILTECVRIKFFNIKGNRQINLESCIY